ncbi:uncharacterized protein [Diadema antillarum]|uniref:uncharacterized protein n=1 Tax=Diadema antillarum TaxID=105358 RepID=UPI003A83A091
MADDGGSAGTKNAGKKKKTSGDRCMVMNCSSTHRNAIVHSMPVATSTGSRLSPIQMAWIHFIQQHRVFDHRQVKHINVCSLHFDDDQYDQTQLQMYRMGLRKLSPTLLPHSIPHIFRKDNVIVNQSAPCSSSSVHPDSTSSETDAELQKTTQPSDHHVQDLGQDVCGPSKASTSSTSSLTSGSGMLGNIRKRHQRRSTSYQRMKEIKEITMEYGRKAAEERTKDLAKDILERSKGNQYRYSVKMVHRRVGVRMRKRSCKVQVKPIPISRGIKKEDFNQPVSAQIQFCDACTQTEKSSLVVPEEPLSLEEPLSAEEPAEEDWEEPDDEVKDPTYTPTSETDPEHKEKPAALSQPKSPEKEEKFIVFESKLLELFQVCISCLSRNVRIEKVCPRSYGSMLKVVATCLGCGNVREWQSQPKIGNLMAGNLLLSAAILFGGGSPTKILRVLQHMNLRVITVQTFMDHQRDYLQPAIIRVAKEEQRKLLEDVRDGEPLVLGGDGRADSPGHSAKYGSYTLLDLKRDKIIDVQLVQSNEVKNSNAMEKEGLARALASLQDKQMKVDTLVTDRHTQVAKWMRETYPEIQHKYDVWHIAKGLKKKINAVAKLKDCEVVGRWKRSIVSHVYWCAASSPDGNGDMIAAKYKSILNHIRNVHDNHGDLFPTCAHGEEYGQREWMRQGTKAFEKLSEEITKTRLVNDIKKMSPLDQTSSVEAFHSVLLYWCPKMLAFSYTGMKCRLFLAMLHWNENAGRNQATRADGTPMYRISYPKAKEGGHTVSKVLTSCTFKYVAALMDETMQLVSGKNKIRSTIPELQAKPALCSRVERPNKEEAVKMLEKHRRFAKQ